MSHYIAEVILTSGGLLYLLKLLPPISANTSCKNSINIKITMWFPHGFTGHYLKLELRGNKSTPQYHAEVQPFN